MISGASEQELELANARANIIMALDNTSTYESWLIIDTYIEKLEKELDKIMEIIEEVEDKEYEDIEETTGDYIVPNTPATENEAYIMACLIAHEQTLNALIRNQKYILERLDKND